MDHLVWSELKERHRVIPHFKEVLKRPSARTLKRKQNRVGRERGIYAFEDFLCASNDSLCGAKAGKVCFNIAVLETRKLGPKLLK